MVHELGQHALARGRHAVAPVAPRTCGAAIAACGGERAGVEDVADDAARERQPVAARFALLLDEALLERGGRGRRRGPGPFPSASISRSSTSNVFPSTDASERIVARAHRAAARSASRPPAGSSRAARRPRSPALARSSRHPCRPRAMPPESTQRADQFLREERIALGRFVKPASELVGDVGGAYERGDAATVCSDGDSGAERHRREAGVVRGTREHARQRMPRRSPSAVGTDDQRRRRAQPTHDVLKRLDRALGAVQVLEEQDERLAAGRCASACGREARRSGTVLGLLRRGLPPPARLRSPVDATRSLGISVSSGRARIEIGGEVGEVRHRRRRACRILASEVVLDELRRSPGTGRSRSCSTNRPCRTRMLRAGPGSSSSSSRRVFPMPGSPDTTANWHVAAQIAAFRRCWSSANSFSRPMNGGHRRPLDIRLGLRRSTCGTGRCREARR